MTDDRQYDNPPTEGNTMHAIMITPVGINVKAEHNENFDVLTIDGGMHIYRTDDPAARERQDIRDDLKRTIRLAERALENYSEPS